MELERYRRQLNIPEIGTEGQNRLAASSVLVVGAGGLGGPVLYALAGAGVGRLVVVDCGLNAMGLGRARILRRRYDWVDYCPFPALVEFLAFHDPTADH